ncbi:hypothetical protein Flavo103_26880 [Flavobacterium collinsii]|uniref:hypothetical protein n=1 Tax=Flavobacterium collinsii TaxID=1114861 RepID=UPI0022C7E734|nr:hypothetical protein [Flavobacterium collinsii]GIQ59552.1 hypothetical protein Flavo103_26880 [Flavobacterium collinsii]
MEIEKTIEENLHHFLFDLKKEGEGEKEAGLIIQKYIKEGSISEDEENTLKIQLSDSLKIIGIGIPFLLLPGASVLLPILIKVADKYHIELMPSAFDKTDGET